MRIKPIVPGEYYHIFNRGNNKQNIFKDDRDKVRFLFLILYFQSTVNFPQIGRSVSHYVKHRVFDISDKTIKNIVKNRYVELINFTLVPNHFHLTVYEKEESGIARYMQRVLNAYTKYFNTRHKQSGHLFQGPYKAVHIKNDRQLLYLSTYIHRNQREIKKWRNREYLYPWSSFKDYIKENRWGELLQPNIITERFKNGKEYKKFCDSSPAKNFLL